MARLLQALPHCLHLHPHPIQIVANRVDDTDIIGCRRELDRAGHDLVKLGIEGAQFVLGTDRSTAETFGRGDLRA